MLGRRACASAYRERLSALITDIAAMCGLTGNMLERATQVLLQADLALAEQVHRP